jgi:hypothetical protein
LAEVVPIEKLVSGSVLAKDVTLQNGSLLLRAGTPLNERHVALLAKHGIATVTIGEIETKSKTVSQDVFAERCGRLDHAFGGIEKVPHMSALKSAAREQLHKTRPWEE